MALMCADEKNTDKGLFLCTLPVGHHGPHRSELPGFTVEWMQQIDIIQEWVNNHDRRLRVIEDKLGIDPWKK